MRYVRWSGHPWIDVVVCKRMWHCWDICICRNTWRLFYFYKSLTISLTYHSCIYSICIVILLLLPLFFIY
jgi:hypothetical protein